MIEPLAASEPSVIGRYRILGLLGRGGMGRVLLGIAPDGRFVAIKQIHPDLLDDQEYRDRFANEVAISARVSGAFTAAVIDFSIAEPRPWLASVFIPGLPLDRAVTAFGPLPVPALRTLAAGLASALHSIHGAGLVHRDLEPANVILAADGPRVIDFGIAQRVGASGELTGAGVVGSVSYMSPEQATEQQLTSASDVFSLGTLLYWAATGITPFGAAHPTLVLAKVVNETPRFDRVPAELRALVAACLHKSPAARPTPSQILDRLGPQSIGTQPWPDPIHRAIREQGRRLRAFTMDPEATQVIVRPRPAAPVPERKRRPRRAIYATALVIVLIAAGLTVALVRRGTDTGTPAAALPTLAELRGTDACAWVRRALGPTLPASAVRTAGTAREIAAWRWTRTEAWGCLGTSGAEQIGVEIGTGLDRFGPADRVVNGFELSRRGTDCAFAVGNDDPAPRWGITVITRDGGACPLAEHAVERLTADLVGLPREPDAGRSLAAVDPCALLSDSEVSGVSARGPGIATAHTCEWRGDTSVELLLELPRQVDVVTETFDAGGGLVLERPSTFDSTMHCKRLYRYRAIDETYVETVTALVISDRRDGSQCSAATALLTSVIARLPGN
ncbi:serine/threonine-protein kinase [Nocardia sp. NPDC005978]|uniref:serine/threonine-protein kinase n=1 Tax=Nocardia sp. NPDC005978 TaxID=3156725 RepID=UPI00339EDE6E